MLHAPAAPHAAHIDEYRLVRTLRTGADGDVVLAHDRRLDRAVVLHLLPGDSASAAALLAGARAVARVSHPGLCAVYRIRESGERPCVVQSFERGLRLDAVPVPMPASKVLDVGRALAGALSALHAAGVAHGEVRADRVVVSSSGGACLFGLRSARAEASAGAMAGDVRDLIAMLESVADPELRDSLVRLAAADGPPLSSEQLVRALESLRRPSVSRVALDENPYRGLRPFEAEHAPLFFGRQSEVAEVLERLRNEPWILVAGPSGAGKSSLVRAGVVPAVVHGALAERSRWDVAAVVPGAHPLSALVAALAPVFGRSAGDLEDELRSTPGLAARVARGRTDAGLLLIVDQFEETMTLADAAERDAFLAVLAGFDTLAPGVRAIVTLRRDFLDRVSGLHALGRDLLRATFLLQPMQVEGLRQAIVGPARARAFELETTAMVEALVSEAGSEEGADALPLLSFVLAELWTERDRARRVLPETALARLGGAAGALARHGDMVLSTLTAEQRRAARGVLLALVTAEGTRARRTRGELVGDGGRDAERALEALIRGRLVVAGETYEIAHDALVRAWPRLRRWLEEASEGRAAAARLAAAAAKWDRLGRGAELLWSARQLGDLDAAGALDGASELAWSFVGASQAAVRQARVRRLAVRVGGPVGALLVAGAIVGALRWNERRQTHAYVLARLAEAEWTTREVLALGEQVDAARAEAFTRYDASDRAGGEARWKDALALAKRESDAFARASSQLGIALARDPLDATARARAADLTLAWLLAAERDHDPDVARDLRARLAQLDDDGSRRARLAAPAYLSVTSDPPGANVTLHPVRVDADGRSLEDEGRPVELGARQELAPGSYVLTASAPGRYPTRYPVLLARAQDERVVLPLPAAADVPAGFVFVPAGDSRFGAADVEGVRAGLSAEPEHAVRVGAFLVGAEEVTYAEYLQFLAVIPAAERVARRPHASGVDLTYDADGVPMLTLGRTTARRGEPFCRPGRTLLRCQDWLRFPVAGVSWADARAYAGWLATGAVRGARLCSEREWERAARGADGRLFAHGEVMRPGDANFDGTYRVDADQMGADAIGAFVADRSPFGALDLGGNVAEWVVTEEGGGAARGGHWHGSSFHARAAFRNVRFNERNGEVGLRVCASAPTLTAR